MKQLTHVSDFIRICYGKASVKSPKFEGNTLDIEMKYVIIRLVSGRSVSMKSKWKIPVDRIIHGLYYSSSSKYL